MQSLLALTDTQISTWVASFILPLFRVTAMLMAMPVFGTILSALVLREATGIHRWSAVLIGFVGVLVMVRPDAGHFPMQGVAVALVAALVTASVSLVLRELGRTESAGVVVFWFTLLSMVPLGLAMPFYAQGHDLVTWGWLLLIGVVGGIAQICLTAALRWGPVSVVLPMDYSTIIWTTLLGVAIGQGWPMASTWIGAAMIAGSGLYIAWREHVRTRQMRAVRAVGNPIASDRPL